MCLYSSMAVLRSSTNLIFLGFPFARVFVNETVCSSLSRNDQVSSRRKASGSSILKKLLTDFISFRTWHCGLTSKCLAAVAMLLLIQKLDYWQASDNCLKYQADIQWSRFKDDNQWLSGTRDPPANTSTLHGSRGLRRKYARRADNI